MKRIIIEVESDKTTTNEAIEHSFKRILSEQFKQGNKAEIKIEDFENNKIQTEEKGEIPNL